MIDITHSKCGAKIGSITHIPNRGEPMMAKAFMRVDASTPKAGERIAEVCPHCKEVVSIEHELKMMGVRK